MENLKSEAFVPIRCELQELERQLFTLLCHDTSLSEDVSNHILSAGGKRLRPAIFLLVCRMLRYKGKHLIPMAAVIEFIHTASLLHDDVIDNSKTRRNKPPANNIWGDEVSVLVGDLIYARASELMASTGKIVIVKLFSKVIAKMSTGELLQLKNLFSPNITTKDYLTILEFKTSLLLSACCKSAGILAEIDEHAVKCLEDFGYNLGFAFQLVDDCFDYWSSTNKTGKDIFADLKEGKVTMPIILILRKLKDSYERYFIEQLIINPKNISDNTHKRLTEILNKYHVFKETMELAEKYTKKAVLCLEHFPSSYDKSPLINLAMKLLERNH